MGKPGIGKTNEWVCPASYKLFNTASASKLISKSPITSSAAEPTPRTKGINMYNNKSEQIQGILQNIGSTW